MRFAVIEYTTKTGQIWRPTPERPNYLGDPQKEIDPTSFACYTTALNGEHIPLKGIILEGFAARSAEGGSTPGGGARRGSVLRGMIYAKKAIKRLTGAWPQWHSLEYLKQFDVLMVVHQLSDANEVLALVERLKREYPKIFIIGVPTQPYEILRSHLDTHPDEKKIFVDYMNVCDIFLTVVKSTQDWYESLTTTPVVYMPQPYPYHYAVKSFKPRTEKSKTILVAGVTQRPDIIKGQHVAVALQKKFPDYTILIPKVPELAYDETALAGATYTILPFEQWREHLATLADTALVINTDYTFTRGRVQTDCAAVGTPSLGSNSDGQIDLFPELASTPKTPVGELVQISERLLSDTQYYAQLATTAREKLQKYEYEDSAARVQALVRTYQE